VPRTLGAVTAYVTGAILKGLRDRVAHYLREPGLGRGGDRLPVAATDAELKTNALRSGGELVALGVARIGSEMNRASALLGPVERKVRTGGRNARRRALCRAVALAVLGSALLGLLRGRRSTVAVETARSAERIPRAEASRKGFAASADLRSCPSPRLGAGNEVAIKLVEPARRRAAACEFPRCFVERRCLLRFEGLCLTRFRVGFSCRNRHLDFSCLFVVDRQASAEPVKTT
jgi:hypothetical protein